MRPAVRYSLWVLAALLGLCSGLGAWLLPGLASSSIKEILIAKAEKRGVHLQIEHVWLPLRGPLTIDGVSLRDAGTADAAPFARIPRLQIDYQIQGVFSPHIWIEQVTVQAPEFYAVRAEDGHFNLESLLQRLMRPDADDEKSGGGGWRKYLSKHIPDIQVEHLRGGVDLPQKTAVATLAGLDLRHLRVTDASFSLKNKSLVQESARFVLEASAQVQGMDQPILLQGDLTWPGKQGALSLRLPGAMLVQWQGWRVQVGSIQARTDGRVAVQTVHLGRDATPGDAPSLASRFELDVREIDVTLAKEAGPELELPPEFKDKLPTPAKLLLQHITEITVEDPVVVAQRPALPAAPSTTDDDDDEATDPQGLSRDAVATKADSAKAKGKAPAKAGHGETPKNGKVAVAAKDDKSASGDKKAEVADGHIVRDKLAGTFKNGAQRLQTQVQKLQKLLGALPVPLVEIHHGRARFADEAQGQHNELSEVSGRVERKPGQNIVNWQLDFHVAGQGQGRAPAEKAPDPAAAPKGDERKPGEKTRKNPAAAAEGDEHGAAPAATAGDKTNTISGHVDVHTGDAAIKVRLDQLPIAPYAAILPPWISVASNTAFQDVDLSLLYTAQPGRMGIEGKATVSHISAELPRISRQRLQDMSVAASGKLMLDLGQHSLKLQNGELTIGKMHVLIDTSVQHFATAPAFDGSLRIPTVPCQQVVDSVPLGFAPMLEGMQCEGDLSYEIKGSLDTANMASLKFDFDAALQTVRITSMGKFIRFDIFDAPFEHHARQKDGTLYTFNTGPGTDMWTPYEAISQNIVKVLTTTEDGGFFGHRGFSLDSIKNAAIENLKRGRFVRGASTITQQLVKNLFFVEREKTISRKVQEAVITWQIERSLSKPQMMELYLNIIELGPKIYGIKAAAQVYFNRSAAELTLLQAIWLGSIVPNPRGFYHQFRDGKISDSWRSYLCWIGATMLQRDKIAAEEFRRLGSCSVVFGGGPDGSEAPPPDMGLGHEGDPSLQPGETPGGRDGRQAPSVQDDEQP